MFPEERRQWLVDRARSEGRLDVAAVSEELSVAVETIRRDLNQLEGHGLLRRVHGGAIPVERVGYEGALAARAAAMSDEKARLAKAAADLLDDAESIYLDEGSTVQWVVERLPGDRPLTVGTNALPPALALAARPNVTLFVLGGRVRNNTLGAVDHWATGMLDDLSIDLAFMGTNGISVARGLTTPDPAVAAVKGSAVAAARRSVLLADRTKFGVDSFCRFARVRDLETIVTDAGLDPDEVAAYAAAGVQVVQA